MVESPVWRFAPIVVGMTATSEPRVCLTCKGAGGKYFSSRLGLVGGLERERGVRWEVRACPDCDGRPAPGRAA
jgi:hypothetical protein